MHNVVINSDMIIGQIALSLINAIISHETIIKDHVLYILQQVLHYRWLFSNKNPVLVALGARVDPGITIGIMTLVAAGALVVKDAIEPGTYLGIPAKKIK